MTDPRVRAKREGRAVKRRMAGLSRGEQVLIVVALALVVAGGSSLYLGERARNQVDPQLIPPAEGKERQPGTVTVDVGGAVWKPGVYELRKGSRVEEALARARPRANADLDQINRARVLRDGEKVLVPEKRKKGYAGEGAKAVHREGMGEGLLDLNTASRKELQSLPGIGPMRADAIVLFRETHGYFSKVEDLLKVSGIGESIYDAMKNRVRVE